jgi:hypothetical protein
MAAKSKKKAAPKKAEPKPVVIESLEISADQSQATFVINGKPHTLTVQELLSVRRDINDQAVGLVH